MINILLYSKKVVTPINYDVSTFPGGEFNIKLSLPDNLPSSYYIVVEASIKYNTEIVLLAMLRSAIKYNLEGNNTTVILKLGYLPYARQDRVCNKGEPYSAEVMCELLNSMDFDEVIIADPHSKESYAKLKNVTVRPQHIFIHQNMELHKGIDSGSLVVVAPDNGATDKTKKLVGDMPFIQGYKQRDLSTGRIVSFGYEGDVKGKDLLIVDDICDGGGTFIGLTKKLLQDGANSVQLYVTHGIFSKGLEPLLDAGISHIYTTNTRQSMSNTNRNLTILGWC